MGDMAKSVLIIPIKDNFLSQGDQLLYNKLSIVFFVTK